MTSRATLVGSFILGALALAVIGIVFFGGRSLFVRHEHVVAFFSESIAGLDVGSPVTFHGVHIGTVQRIAVRYNPATMVAQMPVYLELTPNQLILDGKPPSGAAIDYGRLVAAGLRAQLEVESLVTGQMRVDLDFRPGTPARLVGAIKDMPEIPTVTSGLSRLQTELMQLPLNELAEKAAAAFASVTRVSDRLAASLDSMTKSAVRTTDAATQTLQTTDGAIRQVKSDVSTVLHDLDALLNDTRHQVGARGDELGRTLADADRAVRRAQTLLDALNGLADPRAPLRDDLEAALHDLAAAASSLRSFAATIERDPNAVIVGRGRR